MTDVLRKASPPSRGETSGRRADVEVGGFPAGTEGAIVQLFSEQHAYGVELFDARGETVGLVDVTADDLEPAPEPID